MPQDGPINYDLPSPETLAGINIHMEGPEDRTVIPGPVPPQALPPLPPRYGPGAVLQDPCINICVGGEGTEPSQPPQATPHEG
jgi:hypothetical protein